MEILLTTLKTVGLLLSGVFGLIGTFHDLKNKYTGKITSWGRISIFGIATSILLAVVAQIIEAKLTIIDTRESALAALEETAKLNIAVTNINRTLKVFDDAAFYIDRIKVSMEPEFLQPYKYIFDQKLADEFSAVESREASNFQVHSYDHDENDDFIPITVSLLAESALLPKNSENELIRKALHTPHVMVTFYKNKIDPENFKPLKYGEGDLQLTFYQNERVQLAKAVQEEEYYFNGHFKIIDRNMMTSWNDYTGEILSLPDLLGAQMFIAIDRYGMPAGDSKTDDQAMKYRESFELEVAFIKFGSRKLWLTQDNLTKYLGSRNTMFWEHQFSTNETELLRSPNLSGLELSTTGF